MFKQLFGAVLWLLSAQISFAADAQKTNLIEPEEFSKLVIQKKYQEAHNTAIAEAKLVPDELEYVRSNKLVPYDKRHIYLRRALEYYEVLLATKENSLALKLEKEIFKTLPEKTCLEKLLEISNRANNSEASKRLTALKNQCRQ